MSQDEDGGQEVPRGVLDHEADPDEECDQVAGSAQGVAGPLCRRPN